MFSLLALPFKLAGLALSTLFALLRTASGLIGLLLNPFALILILVIGAALYLL